MISLQSRLNGAAPRPWEHPIYTILQLSVSHSLSLLEDSPCNPQYERVLTFERNLSKILQPCDRMNEKRLGLERGNRKLTINGPSEKPDYVLTPLPETETLSLLRERKRLDHFQHGMMVLFV